MRRTKGHCELCRTLEAPCWQCAPHPSSALVYVALGVYALALGLWIMILVRTWA